MQTLFKLTSLVLITMIIVSSCETIDKLNTVDFDATFSDNLEPTTTGGRSVSENPVFSDTVIINPASEPNVEEYLDHIKDYDIQEIKGTIILMSVPGMTLISAEIGIYNAEHHASWMFANELLAVGKTLVLDNTDGKWDTVRQVLLAGNNFSVFAMVEADASGVTFVVKIEIITQVEAEVI